MKYARVAESDWHLYRRAAGLQIQKTFKLPSTNAYENFPAILELVASGGVEGFTIDGAFATWHFLPANLPGLNYIDVSDFPIYADTATIYAAHKLLAPELFAALFADQDIPADPDAIQSAIDYCNEMVPDVNP